MKFYIFDYAGETVGNPAGYRTIRGASRWANTRKMQELLWARFDNRPDKSKTTVWQILQPGGNSFGRAFFEVPHAAR
jgi:hypothetical protein